MSPAAEHTGTPRKSQLGWRVLLALHLGAVVVGLTTDPLLLPVAVGGAILVLFAWIATVEGLLTSFMMPIWFCWWNTFGFGYMNFAWVRFTSAPQGGSAHEITAWMAALMTGCGALGAASVHAVIGRDALPKRATAMALRWEPLAVSGVFFLLFAAATVSSGWLDARYEHQEFDPLGARYLTGGLGLTGYMVFFFLGGHIGTKLTTRGSLSVLATVGFFALAQGLSGGRGLSLFIVILMLGGAIWRGALPRGQLVALVAGLLIVGTAFAMVVGSVRSRAGFGHGSVSDRVALMKQGAGELGGEGDSDQDPQEEFIGRLYAFQAEDVIEQTIRTQHFAGFEDFDRLKYVFVPLALAPDKLPISNGLEILEREFGYNLGELTSVPITLIGDAYRRGAAPWVAAVGFTAGAVLRLLARLTLLAVGPEFALVCMLGYMLMLISLPQESVLGAIGILTYHWTKYVLITLAFAFATRLLIRVSDARSFGNVGKVR